MDLPDIFYRGITVNPWESEHGMILIAVFNPGEVNTKGWKEISVNWELDMDVVKFTLQRKKDSGEYRYNPGILKLSMNKVSEWLDYSGTLKYVDFELKADQDDPENFYHGNVLLQGDLAKGDERLIKGALASCVHKENGRIFREDETY